MLICLERLTSQASSLEDTSYLSFYVVSKTTSLVGIIMSFVCSWLNLYFLYQTLRWRFMPYSRILAFSRLILILFGFIFEEQKFCYKLKIISRIITIYTIPHDLFENLGIFFRAFWIVILTTHPGWPKDSYNVGLKAWRVWRPLQTLVGGRHIVGLWELAAETLNWRENPNRYISIF